MRQNRTGTRSARRSTSRFLLIGFLALFTTGCSSFGGFRGESGQDIDEADLRESEVVRAAETDAALATIRRMSAFLASRPALQYVAQIQYDAIQPSGEKLEFGSRRELAFVAPDRVRMDTQHWDGSRQLVTFDGHRLAAAIPTQRVYAAIEYAGNAGEAFDHVQAEYGVASPLLDLVRHDLANEIEDRVLSARQIGTVLLDGSLCDQLAIRAEHLDFQIFIRQGEEPVPVRLVIDYHGEDGRPQFRASLSDWRMSAEIPDSRFRYRAPPGAQRVEFPELLDLLLGTVEPRGDSE